MNNGKKKFLNYENVIGKFKLCSIRFYKLESINNGY